MQAVEFEADARTNQVGIEASKVHQGKSQNGGTLL
jgi:hypothetical protein